MLEKLRTYNKFVIVLMLLLSSVLSILSSSPTHATSSYDNVVDKVSNIELHNSGCTTSTIDYTNDWVEEFLSTSSTIYNNGDNKADYVNLFNNKTYWGVSQLETNDHSQKQIYIWFTDASSVSINFATENPPIPGNPSFYVAGVQKSGSGTFARLAIALSGSGSSCSPYIAGRDYTSSSTYYERIAYDEASSASIIGFTFKPWRQSTPVNYPSGYTGELINKEITGSATCGWGDMGITNIAVITSSGADGYAAISDNAYYGKDYTHYLTIPDDNYYLLVSCDGHVAPTPNIDNTASSSLNWACVEYELTDHASDYLCYAS